MKIGALEADRWAGLVFSPGPGRGVGLRFAFTTPSGLRREGGDWYWMVSKVGPHAPDASYARVEFDLDAPPDESSSLSRSSMVLEWARREAAVVLRARATSAGLMELIGDAPWDWTARWDVREGPLGPSWVARGAGSPIVAAFGSGLRFGTGPEPECCPLATVEIAEGQERYITAAVAWGPNAADGAADAAERADGMIERARERFGRPFSRSPGKDPPGEDSRLIAQIADQLMWMVLLKPETAELYVPAGRRWIFPRPLAPKKPETATEREDALSPAGRPTRPKRDGNEEGVSLSGDSTPRRNEGMARSAGSLDRARPGPSDPATAVAAGSAGAPSAIVDASRAVSVPSTIADASQAAAASALDDELPPTPDDWTVFGWDSFFNALLLARISPKLAWSTLLAGIGSRYPNGNVPNWRSRHGGTPDRSHPPIGSFVALRIYRITNAASQITKAAPGSGSDGSPLDRLAEAYPGLLAWNRWWVEDVDGRPRREGITPGLFSWGSDTELVPPAGMVPPWEEGASGHQRAAWESGQDDLPLWEEAEWDPDRKVLAMSAVDLCSYRALDLESLASIAGELGDNHTARELRLERERLVGAMNRVLWANEAGLYLDELPHGRSPRVAASNFLPLLAGAPSREMARWMLRTLADPDRFGGDFVIPTISRDDPAFADQQYWRGAIWPPMNYLVLLGLRRYGYLDLANQLARKGARIYFDQRSSSACYENFDSRTGEGCGKRFQSWTPLLLLGALESAEYCAKWPKPVDPWVQGTFQA